MATTAEGEGPMASNESPPIPVLLLTDQDLLADLVKLTLNHGHFVARLTRDSAEAAELLRQWQPRVVVLDMDTAGVSAADVLRSVVVDQRVGVLALTRRGDLRAKLAAFDMGCDDIMTLPLAPEELLARVLVLVRRTVAMSVTMRPVLKLGELEIDIINRTVRVGSSELHLTSLELSLLYLLAANTGRVLTRDEILDALWGADFASESNVVDRHVRSLRAKLQNGWQRPRFIATVPGRGYRFLPTSTN